MSAIHILPTHFFAQQDTLWLARDLLGKLLTTRFEGKETSGRIVETEAYLGETDRASHAYGGRRTARTETMYLTGGHAYVYLCYGIHHLFNIVTHEMNVPHAILIRALEPMKGIPFMMERRNKIKLDNTLTRGPGSLSQAMGIHFSHSGMLLQQPELFIADDGFRYNEDLMVSSPRIGVDYAGDDAKLPYRFFVKGNLNVSGKKIKT
jgi:DNA-3-methyladenine glycosylase